MWNTVCLIKLNDGGKMIAAKFNVDMSFSAEEIDLISNLIYEYTSGYPYLVSGLCENLDEEISGTKEFPDRSSAWRKEGVYEAEKMIVKEDNTLYQSLIRKLKLHPELRTVLYELLFTGKPIPYAATNDYMKDAVMFGFIKNDHDIATISNRIFETVLYNYFISEEFAASEMYNAGTHEKNQFRMKHSLKRLVGAIFFCF